MAAAQVVGEAAEHVDIYADLNTEEGGDSLEAEADALYDDVLTGSVDSESTLGKQEPKEDCRPAVEAGGGKRFSVYVGNFNWWTSDSDLIATARRHGVKDIVEVKFAENRTNGQSKGYAEMVVSTEESFRRLLETMPQCKINGEKLECRHASRRNLAEFEAQARKRIPLRLNPKGDLERADGKNPSASSPSDPPSLPLPLMFPPAKPPPLMPSYFSTPPPPLPLPPPPLFNTPPPPLFHPPSPHAHIPNAHIPNAHIPNAHIPNTHMLNAHAQNSHTPSLHINPAFFPPNPATHSSSSSSSNNNNSSRKTAFSQPGDGDFEELINRNRTIASSAITKAISAATSGDIRMAIETLYTATAVIKQSRVFYDKRCRMLVESLNDCLNSIETKCFPSSKRDRSRERARSRSRDRYRERSSSTDRDREREREQRRERGRDREHRDRH
ncbi:cleavage and polyadenylation specificity factor subunit 7 [Ictalurus punctatus]|uniref:Cleavage and polyadenylation specificity factor subunit 7 n=1 Tax=Ictalurus punctatus TaxID=7998 RepID=A0A2D0RT27_ICTPU|nr:cleavage and polyadenylation specificity factor subunit 7 [Ictalurus punctatus]